MDDLLDLIDEISKMGASMEIEIDGSKSLDEIRQEFKSKIDEGWKVREVKAYKESKRLIIVCDRS